MKNKSPGTYWRKYGICFLNIHQISPLGELARKEHTLTLLNTIRTKFAPILVQKGQLKKAFTKTEKIHHKIKICCVSGDQKHSIDSTKDIDYETSKNDSQTLDSISLWTLSDSSNSPSSSVSSHPFYQPRDSEFLELERRLNYLINLHTARTFLVCTSIHFASAIASQSSNFIQQENKNKVFNIEKYMDILIRLDSTARTKLDEFNAHYCDFSSTVFYLCLKKL